MQLQELKRQLVQNRRQQKSNSFGLRSLAYYKQIFLNARRIPTKVSGDEDGKNQTKWQT